MISCSWDTRAVKRTERILLVAACAMLISYIFAHTSFPLVLHFPEHTTATSDWMHLVIAN